MSAAAPRKADLGGSFDVWSVTSFSELRKDGIACDRKRLLQPDEPSPLPYVTEQLTAHKGPVIAASDYIRAYPDLIRNWMPRRYTVLGTDGFGRSDTRAALRDFFEVDKRYLALAALSSLVDEGELPLQTLNNAIELLKIDSGKPNPLLL